MRKMHIPAELHVPITAEIEDDLKCLVAKFGEKKVLEALDLLVTKCKWNDWQCVANAIRRITPRNEIGSADRKRQLLRRVRKGNRKSDFEKPELVSMLF